ncbi:MAG: tetratricopeptide repeat protein, partial [Alphaproteobacteria bacterium]
MDDTAERFFEAERMRHDGDLAAAEAAYRALLDIQPCHAGGLEGLAAVHEAEGRPDDAAECRRRAAAIRAAATADVGAALLFRGDTGRSRQCCEQALTLDADCLKAHWLLGDIAVRGGDRAAALAHYRRCREIAPERLGLEFLMAALGEGETPGRAPADYVTAQFDWYAETFDEHLQNTLLYRGPEYVARALKETWQEPAPTILDIGCGTGLLAPQLAGFAGTQVGVDLSPARIA